MKPLTIIGWIIVLLLVVFAGTVLSIDAAPSLAASVSALQTTPTRASQEKAGAVFRIAKGIKEFTLENVQFLMPMTWAPPSGIAPRYEIVVLSVTSVGVQTCSYRVQGSSATFSVRRIRRDMQMEVNDLQTGSRISRQMIRGENPDECVFSLKVSDPRPDGGVILGELGAEAFRKWVAMWHSKTNLPPLPISISVATHAAYSPTSSLLVGGKRDKGNVILTLHDVATGKVRQEIRLDDVDISRGSVRLQFSADEKYVVSIYHRDLYHDGAIHVWETASNSIVLTIPLADVGLLDANFNQTGKQLLIMARSESNTESTTLQIWDLATRTKQQQVTLSEQISDIMSLHPTDSILILAGRDGIIFFDSTTLQERRRLPPMRGLASARFSPDGRTLLIMLNSFSQGGLVRALDAEKGTELLVLEPGGEREVVNMAEEVRQAMYSPDGRLILTTTHEDIQLWDAETGAQKWHWILDDRLLEFLSISYGPSGDLITGVFRAKGNFYWIRIWDARTGQEITRLRGSNPQFSPDGRYLLFSNSGGVTKTQILLAPAGAAK